MSDKKLLVDRLSRYSGRRRAKPPVRAQNASRKRRIESEHELLEAIARDIDVRRAFWVGSGRAPDSYAVYTDFDHTFLSTETDPRHLPKWEKLGEYLKLQILFLVTLEEGGYSFTVNVRPDLQAKWLKESRDPMDRVRREIRKALEDFGIKDLAYAYLVEGKSRSGTSRTKLHLHGFLLSDDPYIAVRFKAAMEQAVAAHPLGKLAAGFAKHSGPAVDIEPAYEVSAGKKVGRGRWIEYVAKNVMKWDARLPGRRVFVSQEGTQTAKALWELLRTDAFDQSH